MPELTLPQFVSCFKSQFILQAGKGGMRKSRYYTAYNNERKVKNDKWGMMVFIHTAGAYGFTDDDIRKELKIGSSLFEVLKKEIPNILEKSFQDQNLRNIIILKSGLVHNSILNKHYVKPEDTARLS